MSSFNVMAIDPGRNAAWAVASSSMRSTPRIGVLPCSGVGRLLRPDGGALQGLLVEHAVDLVLVEEVGARPGQGVSAVFTFGLVTGAILGAVSAACVPCETVRPQDWKTVAGLNGKTGTEAKHASLAAARQFWPEHAETWKAVASHNLAEACLMLKWYFDRGPGMARAA